MPEAVTLRNATSEDDPFLFRLYCDTRRHEVRAWGWMPEQQEAFLRMQFEARRRSYAASYPSSSDRIICLQDAPIGRILVSNTVERLVLVDIALLEAHRNRGIGTLLIRQLIDDCDAYGRSLFLQVQRGNRALSLYRRLGFPATGSDEMYIQMSAFAQ